MNKYRLVIWADYTERPETGKGQLDELCTVLLAADSGPMFDVQPIDSEKGDR